MPEGKDPATPPQDTGTADQVERDPAALSSAEYLDEDELRVDPLETGMEPPERYAESDRWGMTPFEQSQGEPLDDRLAQEEPDVPVPQRVEPAHAGADDEFAAPEATTDTADDVRPPGEDETGALGRGQVADEGGGSVAEAIRTPDEPD